MNIGDYVLATKYRDGDPRDHFVVGFYYGKLGDRFMVVDNNGKNLRLNGFRRCECISESIGNAIIDAIPIIGDRIGYSIWYWRYHPDQLNRITHQLSKRMDN